MGQKRHNDGNEELNYKPDDFEQLDGSESALALDKGLISKLPRATHTGELKIGEAIFKCAVLEDGTRVLTQQTFSLALGRSGNLRERISSDADVVPPFLSPSNLEPFISDDLRKSWAPILFRPKGASRSGFAYGYKAELLPQVCNVYLEAESAGKIKANQRGIVQQCGILVRGLATVGILALVDEATGYQEERDRNELRRILEAYIAKELLPWTKRFPDEFYQQMFRLQGWQYSPLSVRRPQVVGALTNDIVYKRLPPGVLEELREKNPVVKDGRRAHKHHQFLTEDIGNKHLEKHLTGVIMLMRAAANWGQFKRMLERSAPRHDRVHQPELIEYENDDDIADPNNE